MIAAGGRGGEKLRHHFTCLHLPAPAATVLLDWRLIAGFVLMAGGTDGRVPFDSLSTFVGGVCIQRSPGAGAPGDGFRLHWEAYEGMSMPVFCDPENPQRQIAYCATLPEIVT